LNPDGARKFLFTGCSEYHLDAITLSFFIIYFHKKRPPCGGLART
jgi:hypothetical protein